MRSHGNRKTTHCQRGAVGVMTPFLLIFMLAFAALAIDTARLLIVRNELQNAADAAALAGAGGLYPPSPANPATPNWGNGITQGTQAITLNATEGVKLLSAQGRVQAGYWDLSRQIKGLQPQDITLDPTNNNVVPAVQVTVSRSTGNSNSPVSMLLAPVFGILSEPAQATAVAVVAAPSRVGPGALFPLAINKCLYDLYWNQSTGQPVLGADNKPIPFQIDTSYPTTSRSCLSGEWTSFNLGSDANTIKGLVASGNTSSTSIGDLINIALATGVKESVYKAIPTTLPLNVTIPVVSEVIPGSSVPVYAFAGFQITTVYQNGSHSYIEGTFLADQKISNSGGGIGPYYGGYVPPRLAW